MANTAPSPTLRSVILRRVDPKVSNTAQSFAGKFFVFAGLSLSSMRILNLKKYMCTIATSTFFINILKG